MRSVATLAVAAAVLPSVLARPNNKVFQRQWGSWGGSSGGSESDSDSGSQGGYGGFGGSQPSQQGGQ